MRPHITDADCQIVLSVVRRRTKPLTVFLTGITFTAIGTVWLGVAILLGVLNQQGIQPLKEQDIFLRALFAPLLAWVFGRIIKKYFPRKRPFEYLKECPPLVGSPLNDSFPSLHAASTVAFCTALFLMHHPFAVGVGIWAILVSFSRLYLGVHFLSDILAGIFLGTLCGSLVWIAAQS